MGLSFPSQKGQGYHSFLGPDKTSKTSAARGLRRWGKWLLVPVLAAALYGGRHVWLREMGEFLVKADPPQPADIVVVLAGDGYGHRIMKGVELAQQGYVKLVLVDGPVGAYDFNEADLAIQFATRRGAPKELLVPFPMKARSTMAEAQIVDRELRRRQVHKALIVTSTYHTRRTRSVFRRYGSPGIQYVVVAAPDQDFEPQGWWLSRDAEKLVFLEYVKLFNWWLGG